MLEIIGCALAFGFWNGVRGRGLFKHAAKRGEYPAVILAKFFGRAQCCAYLGLTLWLIIPLTYALNAAVLFFLAILLGWGKYFMAFTGANVLHEKENPLVDPVVDRIMGYEPGKAYTPSYCRKYGVWGMTLVGAQFFPMFVYPLISAPDWAWFFPFSALSMGLVYGGIRFLRDKTSAAPAEIIYAMIIGAAYGAVIAG